MKSRIGIDIGGTNTILGLVSVDGKIRCTRRFSTRDYVDAEAFAAALAFNVRSLLKEAGIPQHEVEGIGIGAPNGNIHKGTIEHAPNLAFKGIVPLAGMIREFFPSWKVLLTNDANAAALGERLFGKAAAEDHFLFITLGTGVGSGVFSHGKLVYGHDGFAGEVGHMIVEENGRKCGCGRHGCLETYASATGMVRTAKELLKEAQAVSTLAQMEEILEARHISEAAAAGDELAKQVVDFSAKKLALALANAVMMTSPAVIYLFGGMANAGELLFRPLRAYFEEHLLNVFKGKVRIEKSALPGSDAAVLGAAALLEEGGAPTGR